MARILLVGGAGRADALASSGHVIEQADGVDPDRLATLTPQLDGVSVVCWLFGDSGAAALHGDRLASLRRVSRRHAGTRVRLRAVGRSSARRGDRYARMRAVQDSVRRRLTGRRSCRGRRAGAGRLEAAARDRVDRQGEGEDGQQHGYRDRRRPCEAAEREARCGRRLGRLRVGGRGRWLRRLGLDGLRNRRCLHEAQRLRVGDLDGLVVGLVGDLAAPGAGAGARAASKLITSSSRACQSLRSCSTQRSQFARCAARRRGPGSASAPSSSSDRSRSARSHHPLPGSGKAARLSALRARASASARSASAMPVSAQTSGRVRPTRSTSDSARRAASSRPGSVPSTCTSAAAGSTGPDGRWGTGRRAARSIAAEDSPRRLPAAGGGARRSARWRPTRSAARPCRWGS